MKISSKVTYEMEKSSMREFIFKLSCKSAKAEEKEKSSEGSL